MRLSPLRWLAPLATAATLAAPAAAGDATLTRVDGVLGSSVVYDLTGDNGEVYVLVPSFTAGPTPLVLLDGVDSRSMAVGIELLNVISVGILFGGAGQATYPLPADPTLAGFALNAQFFTYNGVTPTFADELSNATSFVLALPDSVQYALSPSAQARQGHSVTALDDGTVLVVGGDEPDGVGGLNVLDTAEIFDPQTQTSNALPSTLTHARSTHQATRLADGRVLITGGYDATNTVRNTAEVYDPVTQTFTAVGSMSDARTQHTATLLADGRVFVLGGGAVFDLSDVLGTLSSVNKSGEIFDPGTGNWTSTAPFPITQQGVAGHAASLLPSGRVLVSGGVYVAVFIGIPLPSINKTCYRYDPGTDSWLTTKSMPNDRVYHGQLTLSSGKVLEVGGADGDFVLLSFSTYPDAALYDETSDTWTTVAPLGHPRAYPNLFEIGGEVLVAGGLSTIDISTGSGTPEQWIESTTTGVTVWSDSAMGLLPREVGRFAPVDGGARLVIVGTGDDGVAGSVDRTTEVHVR